MAKNVCAAKHLEQNRKENVNSGLLYETNHKQKDTEMSLDMTKPTK